MVTELPPLPSGWQPVAYACLDDGGLSIVGTDADLRAEWRRDADGTPLGQPHELAKAAVGQIWTFDGKTLGEGSTFPLLTTWPMVDRFPDGRWLVASARAFDEANARLLDPYGVELRRIRLGDGIERLKIDAAGNIWVGWFDEGVFGNDEWRVPGSEWPPSSTCIAAFDDDGNVLADASSLAPRLILSDCYALNVVGKEAYACTHMDFPVIKMSIGSSPEVWNTELSGTRAIAVKPPYLLAAGGYGDDGDRVVLLRLGSGRGWKVREWRLPFKVGYPDEVDLVDGRGGMLHVVREWAWYRWRIDAFIDAAEQ